MLHWIDANPWLSIGIFFAAGALVGLIVKAKRRGKYESKETAA